MKELLNISVVRFGQEDEVFAVYVNESLRTYARKSLVREDDWVSGFLTGLSQAGANFQCQFYHSQDSVLNDSITEKNACPPFNIKHLRLDTPPLVLSSDNPELCPTCQRDEASAFEHSCPYQSEINDYHDDYCKCCSSCEHECAMDV